MGLRLGGDVYGRGDDLGLGIGVQALPIHIDQGQGQPSSGHAVPVPEGGQPILRVLVPLEGTDQHRAELAVRPNHCAGSMPKARLTPRQVFPDPAGP